MGFTFFESRETKFKFSVGNIFIIVTIFFIAGFIARVVRIVLKKNLSQREWIDKGKEFTMTKLATYLIYTIAFVVAIESIGADLSSLLLASAALLVGVGLGLQFIFADIVSGFILLFEGTFKVGDIIELDSSGQAGQSSSGSSGLVARVERIDVRTSKVMTRDGNFIIIPNSTLTRDNIVNWSHSHAVTRFRIKVGVAYGSDTQKVREVLEKCALQHPEVDRSESIIVRFSDFGDSSLDFELFFWAMQTWTIETIKSDIRFAIDREFRKEGIHIPFPQRDLHIVSDATKPKADHF
jgi:small-conductance mechanosensitive channel